MTRLLGRVIVDTDAPLQQAWTQPVAAYRVNRSFRHFGHNAPAKTVTNATTGSTITGAYQSDTGFQRHVYAQHDCTNTSASIALKPNALPLDAEVADLQRGMRVIVQTKVLSDATTTAVAVSVVRKVADIDVTTLGFGNLNGPSSVLLLDQPLVRHVMSGSPRSDVRDYRIHEVTSPAAHAAASIESER